MLKQWRVALIMMVVMAFGIFISACGSTTSTGSSSTPTVGTLQPPALLVPLAHITAYQVL